MIQNLAEGFKELGHEPEILHIDPNDFNSGYRDFIPDLTLVRSIQTVSPIHYIYSSVVRRETAEAINRFQPDIVHVFHVRAWPALFAAKEFGIPSVVSAHALELGDKRISGLAFNCAGAVHAVSEFTASLIQRDHNVTASRIIPPSVNVRSIQNKTSGPESTKDILCISRLVERKNVKTIINAWREIDNDIKRGRNLLIAGDGPQYGALSQISENSDDVNLLGQIRENEKYRLLSESEIFVLPAGGAGYDVEGFGTVYLEAQAARTPVIGSSVGGVPEAVGEGGVLLENEESVAELTELIIKLITDDDIRRHCLDAIEERILNFDILPVAKEYIELYNELKSHQ